MIYKRGGHWHMDVTIHGVRYREALDSSDRREALALEKKRIAEIQSGRAASKSGREFARHGHWRSSPDDEACQMLEDCGR